MAAGLTKEAIGSLMKAVAGVLKDELVRVHRRAESTDQLLDDLERRLTLAEQRLAAMEWERLKQTDDDGPNDELAAQRHSRTALERIANDA